MNRRCGPTTPRLLNPRRLVLRLDGGRLAMTSRLFITLFIPFAVTMFVSVPVAMLIPLQMYLGLDIIPFLSGASGAVSVEPAGGGTPSVAKPAETFKVGELVEGNWMARGHWYPGKIAAVNEGALGANTYNINYHDGDKEGKIPVGRIRRRGGGAGGGAGQAARQPKRSTFKVGDLILGNWQSQGRMYPGKIVRVNPDGSYDVHYHDGDKEKHMPTARLVCASQPCGETGSAAAGADGRSGMLDACPSAPRQCSVAAVKKACHYLQNSANQCDKAFAPAQGRCLTNCWAAAVEGQPAKKGSTNLCEVFKRWKEQDGGLVCARLEVKELSPGDKANIFLVQQGA